MFRVERLDLPRRAEELERVELGDLRAPVVPLPLPLPLPPAAGLAGPLSADEVRGFAAERRVEEPLPEPPELAPARAAEAALLAALPNAFSSCCICFASPSIRFVSLSTSA